jgi:hypothetical protein
MRNPFRDPYRDYPGRWAIPLEQRVAVEALAKKVSDRKDRLVIVLALTPLAILIVAQVIEDWREALLLWLTTAGLILVVGLLVEAWDYLVGRRRVKGFYAPDYSKEFWGASSSSASCQASDSTTHPEAACR